MCSNITGELRRILLDPGPENHGTLLWEKLEEQAGAGAVPSSVQLLAKLSAMLLRSV